MTAQRGEPAQGHSSPQLAGSMFCPNCARLVGLVERAGPADLLAVDLDNGGYTPTDRKHACRAAS